MITPVSGSTPYAGFARRASSFLIVSSANVCWVGARSFIAPSQTKYVTFVPTATIADNTCTSLSGRYQSMSSPFRGRP